MFLLPHHNNPSEQGNRLQCVAVWLSGRFKKDRRKGRGRKKSRGEPEGKTRAGLSFSHGKVCQCFSAKLDSSRSAKSSVLSTGVGCSAPAAPTAAKQVTASRRTELPASQTIAVPAAPSTRHAAVVYPSSKPFPHTIACRPSPTAHDGEVTTETLGQTS